jgi:acetylcholinesterase
MVGHNANEGPLFSNPSLTTTTQFSDALKASYPGIPQSSLSYIANVLYPPVFDGSYGYKNQIERQILLVSEASFTCNTYFLDLAYGNKTYAYQFSVPPAFHGFDVPFTYFNGNATTVFGYPKIAVALQEYITSFAETGVPKAKGYMDYPIYGPNAQIANLNVTGVSKMTDPSANKRCLWWQKGLIV